jgi:hypothetical protein
MVAVLLLFGLLLILLRLGVGPFIYTYSKPRAGSSLADDYSPFPRELSQSYGFWRRTSPRLNVGEKGWRRYVLVTAGGRGRPAFSSQLARNRITEPDKSRPNSARTNVCPGMHDG